MTEAGGRPESNQASAVGESLVFTISFRSGFRVGASYGRDGIDLAVDHAAPLPGDHLKGLMRAQADRLAALGRVRREAVDAVFGTTAAPSPWMWTDADPVVEDGVTTQGWQYTICHRVEIDPDAHAAIKDHLVSGEQAWSARAAFRVLQRASVQNRPAHVSLLRLSARGVHGVGGWRRRGLGWVGVTPDDGTDPAADLRTLRDFGLPGTEAPS